MNLDFDPNQPRPSTQQSPGGTPGELPAERLVASLALEALFFKIYNTYDRAERVELCKKVVREFKLEGDDLKKFQGVWDSIHCTDREFDELFEIVCKCSQKALAISLLDHEKERPQIRRQCTRIAARTGNLAVVELIFAKSSSLIERLFTSLSSRSEVIELLKDSQSTLLEHAIAQKNYALLEALCSLEAKDIDISMDEKLFFMALKSKDPRVIQALLKRIENYGTHISHLNKQHQIALLNRRDLYLTAYRLSSGDPLIAKRVFESLSAVAFAVRSSDESSAQKDRAFSRFTSRLQNEKELKATLKVVQYSPSVYPELADLMRMGPFDENITRDERSALANFFNFFNKQGCKSFDEKLMQLMIDRPDLFGEVFKFLKVDPDNITSGNEKKWVFLNRFFNIKWADTPVQPWIFENFAVVCQLLAHLPENSRDRFFDKHLRTGTINIRMLNGLAELAPRLRNVPPDDWWEFNQLCGGYLRYKDGDQVSKYYQIYKMLPQSDRNQAFSIMGKVDMSTAWLDGLIQSFKSEMSPEKRFSLLLKYLILNGVDCNDGTDQVDKLESGLKAAISDIEKEGKRLPFVVFRQKKTVFFVGGETSAFSRIDNDVSFRYLVEDKIKYLVAEEDKFAIFEVTAKFSEDELKQHVVALAVIPKEKRYSYLLSRLFLKTNDVSISFYPESGAEVEYRASLARIQTKLEEALSFMRERNEGIPFICIRPLNEKGFGLIATPVHKKIIYLGMSNANYVPDGDCPCDVVENKSPDEITKYLSQLKKYNLIPVLINVSMDSSGEKVHTAWSLDNSGQVHSVKLLEEAVTDRFFKDFVLHHTNDGLFQSYYEIYTLIPRDERKLALQVIGDLGMSSEQLQAMIDDLKSTPDLKDRFVLALKHAILVGKDHEIDTYEDAQLEKGIVSAVEKIKAEGKPLPFIIFFRRKIHFNPLFFYIGGRGDGVLMGDYYDSRDPATIKINYLLSKKDIKQFQEFNLDYSKIANNSLVKELVTISEDKRFAFLFSRLLLLGKLPSLDSKSLPYLEKAVELIRERGESVPFVVVEDRGSINSGFLISPAHTKLIPVRRASLEGPFVVNVGPVVDVVLQNKSPEQIFVVLQELKKYGIPPFVVNRVGGKDCSAWYLDGSGLACSFSIDEGQSKSRELFDFILENPKGEFLDKQYQVYKLMPQGSRKHALQMIQQSRLSAEQLDRLIKDLEGEAVADERTSLLLKHVILAEKEPVIEGVQTMPFIVALKSAVEKIKAEGRPIPFLLFQEKDGDTFYQYFVCSSGQVVQRTRSRPYSSSLNKISFLLPDNFEFFDGVERQFSADDLKALLKVLEAMPHDKRAQYFLSKRLLKSFESTIDASWLSVDMKPFLEQEIKTLNERNELLGVVRIDGFVAPGVKGHLIVNPFDKTLMACSIAGEKVIPPPFERRVIVERTDEQIRALLLGLEGNGFIPFLVNQTEDGYTAWVRDVRGNVHPIPLPDADVAGKSDKEITELAEILCDLRRSQLQMPLAVPYHGVNNRLEEARMEVLPKPKPTTKPNDLDALWAREDVWRTYKGPQQFIVDKVYTLGQGLRLYKETLLNPEAATKFPENHKKMLLIIERLKDEKDPEIIRASLIELAKVGPFCVSGGHVGATDHVYATLTGTLEAQAKAKSLDGAIDPLVAASLHAAVKVISSKSVQGNHAYNLGIKMLELRGLKVPEKWIVAKVDIHMDQGIDAWHLTSIHDIDNPVFDQTLAATFDQILHVNLMEAVNTRPSKLSDEALDGLRKELMEELCEDSKYEEQVAKIRGEETATVKVLVEECEALKRDLAKLDPNSPAAEAKKQELEDKQAAIKAAKTKANHLETRTLISGIEEEGLYYEGKLTFWGAHVLLKRRVLTY